MDEIDVPVAEVQGLKDVWLAEVSDVVFEAVGAVGCFGEGGVGGADHFGGDVDADDGGGAPVEEEGAVVAGAAGEVEDVEAGDGGEDTAVAGEAGAVVGSSFDDIVGGAEVVVLGRHCKGVCEVGDGLRSGLFCEGWFRLWRLRRNGVVAIANDVLPTFYRIEWKRYRRTEAGW